MSGALPALASFLAVGKSRRAHSSPAYLRKQEASGLQFLSNGRPVRWTETPLPVKITWTEPATSSAVAGKAAQARRLRAGVVSARVVGQVPVGVVGMKQRLVQQVPDVDVGGGVVDESAFPPALDQPGQPQLRQVLGQ